MIEETDENVLQAVFGRHRESEGGESGHDQEEKWGHNPLTFLGFCEAGLYFEMQNPSIRSTTQQICFKIDRKQTSA